MNLLGDPLFLLLYGLSIALWVAGGFAICSFRHKQRGIDVGNLHVPDLIPDGGWSNDPSAPKEPSLAPLQPAGR